VLQPPTFSSDQDEPDEGDLLRFGPSDHFAKINKVLRKSAVSKITLRVDDSGGRQEQTSGGSSPALFQMWFCWPDSAIS
jgi:hypothetical protein